MLRRLSPDVAADTVPIVTVPPVVVPRVSTVKFAAPFSPSILPSVMVPPAATPPPPDETVLAALPSMSSVPPVMEMLPPLEVTLAAKWVLEPLIPVVVMLPADVQFPLIVKSSNWETWITPVVVVIVEPIVTSSLTVVEPVMLMDPADNAPVD